MGKKALADAPVPCAVTLTDKILPGEVLITTKLASRAQLRFLRSHKARQGDKAVKPILTVEHPLTKDERAELAAAGYEVVKLGKPAAPPKKDEE